MVENVTQHSSMKIQWQPSIIVCLAGNGYLHHNNVRQENINPSFVRECQHSKR